MVDKADFEGKASLETSVNATTPDPYVKYVQDITGIELLEPDQEIHYSRLARAGDFDARQILIESNLRLVVKIARKYVNRGNASNNLLDLIDEGNIGLMKAIDRFDPELGYRFSTYAVWWIRESIESYLMNHSRTVRIPIHVQKEISKLSKAAKRASNELQRVPTLKEVACQEKLSIDEMSELMTSTSHIDCRATAQLKERSQYELEEIPEPVSQSPSGLHESTQLMQSLEKLVDTLSPKHRDIIVRRYGLFGQERETLADLSDDYQLSKERIRQLQKEGLQKLKSKLSFDGWD